MLLTELTSAPDDKSIDSWILPKIKWKSIADTNIDTAYEKYRWYLHQYLKSIADTIGSNTTTATLTTLTVGAVFDYHGITDVTKILHKHQSRLTACCPAINAETWQWFLVRLSRRCQAQTLAWSPHWDIQPTNRKNDFHFIMLIWADYIGIYITILLLRSLCGTAWSR